MKNRSLETLCTALSVAAPHPRTRLRLQHNSPFPAGPARHAFRWPRQRPGVAGPTGKRYYRAARGPGRALLRHADAGHQRPRPSPGAPASAPTLRAWPGWTGLRMSEPASVEDRRRHREGYVRSGATLSLVVVGSYGRLHRPTSACSACGTKLLDALYSGALVTAGHSVTAHRCQGRGGRRRLL